jgi:tyrosinase
LSNRSLEQGSFILNVERIEYNPRNPISYHIYINLPQGATPDPSSPYYAGMLSLFALPQRGNFSIAITDVVRELQRLNLMTGDSISVTFVPPPEDVAELQRTARSTQELQQAVRFNRVEIARE